MSTITKRTGKILDWDLFKRVVRLARPFKKAFIGATALAIFLAIISPFRPFLIQLTVDNYILIPNQEGLVNMAMLLVGILIVEAILRYNFIYLTNWLGQSVIKDLRVRVFNHILKFRLRYFDNTAIGTSTTRTINDVETINDIFSQGLITIIADLLTLFMVIGVMLYTDWKLTLMCLAPFPLIIYSTYVFKEKVKGSFQTVRTQVSRLNAFLQEHITGMSIVQVFGAEEKELKKYHDINARHRDAHVESIWYYSIFFPVLEIILAAAMGLMVWFGSNLVIDGQASLGVLIAFIMYLNMLFRPLRMLADKFNTLQMGLVASERIFNLLDREEERITNEGEKKVDEIKGKIEFDDVWFAYNEKDMVLKGVSFSIEAGQTLAIVGPTGAGKSSIINILNRFYDIQKGTIKIDGRNVEDYDLHSLRKNIGLVLQDVFLFSGSVKDNISLRSPEIKDEQVYEAAEIVGANEFIEKLPNQYDYNVMERGATLSLGQRQLISFIRALVFDPRILILDEATSSIDTETEWLVQSAIEKLIKGRTSIVIAHRLSTIQNADKIMVLNKGEIMEMGTHEELLKLGGHYRELHDTQFSAAEAV
ncbi:MAG: ABC transporter ATP-binding protein [Chitinophagales bacterium]